MNLGRTQCEKTGCVPLTPGVLVAGGDGRSWPPRTAAARSEVDGVISQGSYAAGERMVIGFMEMMGAPRALALVLDPFVKLALATIYGVWPATASPVHDIGVIAPHPVLLMHGDATPPFTWP